MSAVHRPDCVSLPLAASIILHRQTYLAIFQREHQYYPLALDLLVHHLRGDPSLGGVGLPGLGSDIVGMRHGGGEVLGSAALTDRLLKIQPSTAAQRDSRKMQVARRGLLLRCNSILWMSRRLPPCEPWPVVDSVVSANVKARIRNLTTTMKSANFTAGQRKKTRRSAVCVVV